MGLARLAGGDLPGTLVVRRRPLLAVGGYCLLENLELIRTVEAAGGRAVWAQDLYVRRLPPPTRHFLGQRVRQAYDEFARPAQLVAALALLPAICGLVLRRSWRTLSVGLLGSIMLAEAGRRRAGGAHVFPATSALFAPLWLMERAVCSWAAVGQRVFLGGTAYAGGVLSRAATPKRVLRRRLSPRAPAPAGTRAATPRPPV